MNIKMEHRNNRLQKLSCLLIFGVTFIYLLMQFRNVMVYFDDYGYYSLSYGIINPDAGTDFSLGELIDFMRLHYIHANGRILWFFIWLFIYWIGDLALVQIAAAVITTGVLVAIWKYTSKEENKVTSAICVCALFGLFPIEMQQHGTYWMAAFFHYVASVLPLMAFFILYMNNRESGFSKGEKILMAFLVLLSAYSQEQMSVTILFVTILILLWDIWEKRNTAFNYVLIMVALLSVAALMLNPGIQDRASMHDMPLLERILFSTERVIRMFFYQRMRIFLIMLFGTVITVSVFLFKSDNKQKRLLDLLGIGYGCFSIVVYFCPTLQNVLNSICENRIRIIIIGVLSVLLVYIQVCRFYVFRNEYGRLIVFSTAVASVGCLIFVPEIPWRLLLPSWLLLLPLLIDGIAVLDDILKIKKAFRLFTVLICAALVIPSINNALDIYRGYQVNAITQQYNDAVLRDAAEQEKNGNPVERIHLKEIPDPMYGCVMVYQDGLQYMKTWMLNYYGITSDPELCFSMDGRPITSAGEVVEELGNGVFIKIKTTTIEKVHTMQSPDGIVLAVECSPIYDNCQIEVNGITYPTTVGDIFVSAVIGNVEMPLFVSVVVPNAGLHSNYVIVD